MGHERGTVEIQNRLFQLPSCLGNTIYFTSQAQERAWKIRSVARCSGSKNYFGQVSSFKQGKHVCVSRCLLKRLLFKVQNCVKCVLYLIRFQRDNVVIYYFFYFNFRLYENFQSCNLKSTTKSNEFEHTIVSRSPSITSLPLGHQRSDSLTLSQHSVTSSNSVRQILLHFFSGTYYLNFDCRGI